MIFLFVAIFLFIPGSIESMANNIDKPNKCLDFNNINDLLFAMDNNLRNVQEKVQICDKLQSQVSNLHSQLSILDRKLVIISKSLAKMNDLEAKLSQIPTILDEMSKIMINELKRSFSDKNQGEALEKVLTKVNQIEIDVEDIKDSCDKSDIKKVINENFKSQNLKIENLMETCTKSKDSDKTCTELKSRINQLDNKLNRVPDNLVEISTKIDVLEESAKEIRDDLEEKNRNESLKNILNKINNIEYTTENLTKSFEEADIKNSLNENFKSQNEKFEKLIKKCSKSDETNTNTTITEESLILSNSFDYTFCTSVKNQSGVFKFHTNFINLKEETRDYGVRSCYHGWMVIQNRNSYEYQENFNKSWYEYKHGFGDLRREFWFGNDFLHRLSNQNELTLRIELESFDNEKRYAEYGSFKIASESEGYRLSLGRFVGTVPNSLDSNNKMKFSTYDRRNDRSVTLVCSITYGSGWWFNKCFSANLNGFYFKTLTKGWTGIVWHGWLKTSSLKAARIMVKPKRYMKQFDDLSFQPYDGL